MSGYTAKFKYRITYLYLLSDGNGHCKIGVAKDIKRRVSILQTGNPHKLIQVFSWDFIDEKEAYFIEQLSLYGCINSRATGEWVNGSHTSIARLINFIIKKVSANRRLHIRNKTWIWERLGKHNRGAI